MNYILKTLKSNTNQAGLLMFLMVMPATSAPIWGVVSRMGVGDPYLAWLQGAAAFLGLVGVLWGRAKAKGPIGSMR